MHCACLFAMLEAGEEPFKVKHYIYTKLEPLSCDLHICAELILYFSELLSLIAIHYTQRCTSFKEMLVPLPLLP